MLSTLISKVGRRLTEALICGLLLASCGGSSSDSHPPADQTSGPPDSPLNTGHVGPPSLSAKTFSSFDAIDLSPWNVNPSTDSVEVVANDGAIYKMAPLSNTGGAYIVPAIKNSSDATLSLNRNGTTIYQQQISVFPRTKNSPGTTIKNFSQSAILKLNDVLTTDKAQTDTEYRSLILQEVDQINGIQNLINAVQQFGSVTIGIHNPTGQPISFDRDSLHVMDEMIAKLQSIWDVPLSSVSTDQAKTAFLKDGTKLETIVAATSAESDKSLRDLRESIILVGQVSTLVSVASFSFPPLAAFAATVAFTSTVCVVSIDKSAAVAVIVQGGNPREHLVNLATDSISLVVSSEGMLVDATKTITLRETMRDFSKGYLIDKVSERVAIVILTEAEQKASTPNPSGYSMAFEEEKKCGTFVHASGNQGFNCESQPRLILSCPGTCNGIVVQVEITKQHEVGPAVLPASNPAYCESLNVPSKSSYSLRPVDPLSSEMILYAAGLLSVTNYSPPFPGYCSYEKWNIDAQASILTKSNGTVPQTELILSAHYSINAP